jgi:hypothetical protein
MSDLWSQYSRVAVGLERRRTLDIVGWRPDAPTPPDAPDVVQDLMITRVGYFRSSSSPRSQLDEVPRQFLLLSTTVDPKRTDILAQVSNVHSRHDTDDQITPAELVG